MMESWYSWIGDALNEIRKEEEEVIKRWMTLASYTNNPIGYYRDIANKTMEIYATRPGCLIGVGGKYVDVFKQMLKDTFGGDWKVKFIEIRGGMVEVRDEL